MIIKVYWKVLALCLIVTLGVGALSALFVYGNVNVYSSLNLPPLAPPSWVFPVVWTVLYILMGISAYLIVVSGKDGRASAIHLYWAQLVVNFFWPILFFDMQNYLLALLWLLLLWVLVFVMIFRFKAIDKRAAYLQIPYLIWLTLAAYLNAGVVLLN